jgi:hypothetical protein
MDSQVSRQTAICDEFARIEENARYTAVAHFISAEHLRKLHHWVLGPVPILFGGIAAYKGFNEASFSALSGVLAVLAGVSGSLLSFWNFADSRSKHQTAGAAYKAIEHDARRSRLVDGPYQDIPTLRAALADLGDRYNKLGAASPSTSNFAFKRAQNLIASGAYQNTVDSHEERSPALSP